MKVVLIQGQSHQGITCHMGRRMAELMTNQQSVTEFFLPRDMDQFCTGCLSCVKNGLSTCPHHEKMSPILEAMMDADVMIFTTPVYCMRTTGSMKAFLDHCFYLWMNHQPDERMFHKQAVIIAGGAGGGMGKAAEDIRTSLDNWGVSHIFICKSITAAYTWQGVSEKRKAKMEHKISRMAQKVKKQSNNCTVRPGQKFHFLCMILFHKKHWGMREDFLYWEKQGWLKGNRPWKKNKHKEEQ